MVSPVTRGLTFASLPALGVPAVGPLARRAESLGYRSLWTAETTGAEAFSLLTTAGSAAPGVALGTGVLALQLRTPMLAAMGAATLAATTPGREVLLGVGISSPVVVESWHGATYGDRPLAQAREYLTLVTECLSGEPVTFDGDFYRCRNFRLAVRFDQRPKVVLGALNQRMLQLAGELADGVLLNYLPATAVPWCVEQVRAGEARSGRTPGSCAVYSYVHVGVCDRDSALDPARRDLFSYAVVPAYAAAFSRAGFADEVAACAEAHGRRDREGALAAISERMIDAIDICGDAQLVSDAVAAYEAAGVDHAIVMPLPWGPDRAAIVDDTIVAAAT